MNRKVLSYRGIGFAVLFLTSMAAAFSQAQAQEPLPAQSVSSQELETLTTYYYKDPQPGKALSAFKNILSQEELIKDTSHFYPVAHLFATIAHNDANFLSALKTLSAEFTGTRKDALGFIIRDAQDFVSPEATTPANLDALWAEFIATGDIAPVKKIIKVLGYPNTGMGMLLIGAAEWSLASNAQQHEIILSLIQEEAKTAQGPIKTRLDKILGEVGK